MDCQLDANRRATVTFHWREHANRLANGLEDLFRRGCQVDTDVLSGRRTPGCHSAGLIRVHRLVLSAFLSSKVIDDATTTLDLNDFTESPDDVRALVEFVYTGRLTVWKDRVQPIRRLAKALHFEDLLKIIDTADENVKSSSEGDGNKLPVKLLIINNRDEEGEERKQVINNDRTSRMNHTEDLQKTFIDLVDESTTAGDSNHPVEQAVSDGVSINDSVASTTNGADDRKIKVEDHRDALHCPLCSCAPTTFDTKQDLRNHVLVIHPNDKLFECNLCDFDTLNEVELERHGATHETDRTVSVLAEKISQDGKNKRFKCGLCSKSFRRRFARNYHVKLTHKEDASICMNDASRSPQPTVTITERGKSKRFPCDHCDKSFTKASNRIRHVRNSHADQPSSVIRKKLFNCRRCGNKWFACKASLMQHVHLMHRKKLPRKTGDSRPSIRDLRSSSDKKAEIDGKLFTCHLCSNSFTRESFFEVHLMVKHNSTLSYENRYADDDDGAMPRKGKGVFDCQRCSKSFTRPFSLQRHVKAKHGVAQPSSDEPEEKRGDIKNLFSCDQCPRTFYMESSLKRHVTITHSIIDRRMQLFLRSAMRNALKFGNRFSCRLCPKSFTRQAFLEYHLKVKHKSAKNVDDPSKRFHCQQCSKKFKHNSSLVLHVKRKHEVDETAGAVPSTKRVRRCWVCRLNFKTTLEFRCHLSDVHADKKVYECLRCDFATTSRKYMRQHNLVLHEHKDNPLTTINSFHCPHCPKIFGKKCARSTHVRHKHKEKLPVGPNTDVGDAESRENSNDVEMEVEPTDDRPMNSIEAKPTCQDTIKMGSGAENVDNLTVEEDIRNSVSTSYVGSDGPADANHRCLLCSFRSDSEEGLRYHVSGDHPEIEVFQCKCCDFWTIQQRRMKGHRCRKNRSNK